MTDANSTPAAERMRRYRERRRRGLSCIKVQLRRSEVDALIGCRLLQPVEREDRQGLSGGVPSVSRCKPNCRTPTVTHNARMVTCHGRERDGACGLAR